MATKFTICQSSALSQQIKSNTISQEFQRRLNNTSQEQDQKTVNKHLEDFITTCKLSGYNGQQIRNDMTSALTGFERKLKRVQEGKQELHREKAGIKANTRFKKAQNKTSWFKKKSK